MLDTTKKMPFQTADIEMLLLEKDKRELAQSQRKFLTKEENLFSSLEKNLLLLIPDGQPTARMLLTHKPPERIGKKEEISILRTFLRESVSEKGFSCNPVRLLIPEQHALITLGRTTMEQAISVINKSWEREATITLQEDPGSKSSFFLTFQRTPPSV